MTDLSFVGLQSEQKRAGARMVAGPARLPRGKNKGESSD